MERKWLTPLLLIVGVMVLLVGGCFVWFWGPLM
jgi:hypothetical protein